MFIRDVKDSDIDTLKKMLEDEGVDKLGGTMKVCEDKGIVGFYSYAIKREIPFLWHFCVKKERRSFRNALFLIREYMKQMKQMGYNKTLILVNKDYLCKLIERYFKTKSLGIVKEHNVYHVEVI